MASLLAHGVRLPLVLGHTGMDGPTRNQSWPWMSKLCAAAYWTMSGRIGALNTSGRGCVCSLALPSAEMIVTTGLLVILSAVVVVVSPSRLEVENCPRWT